MLLNKFTYHLVNIKQVYKIFYKNAMYLFTYHLVNIKQKID